MERQPTPPSPDDYSGTRLTLKDIGVDPIETPATEDAGHMAPNNVVELRPRGTAEADKDQASKERNKKLKALFLMGATLFGAGKLTIETFRSQVQPAPHVQSLEDLRQAGDIDIDDVAVGSTQDVSPYSFTISADATIRTSPHVDRKPNSDMPTENRVQHTDLTGDVIVHPVIVPDETNEKNSSWVVFFDTTGHKFAISIDYVEPIKDPSITSNNDVRVTVDRTTNMGIIAHDNNNISMQVATVVDTSSIPNT